MRRSYSIDSLIPSINRLQSGPTFKEKCLHFLRYHFLIGLARYVGFCIIITLTVTVCMLVQQRYGSGTSTYSGVTFDWSYLPQYAPINSSYANYTVLLDGHCHTPYLSAEQNIEWHLANGYNAFIVTEHNNLEDGFHVQQVARDKYANQVMVLVGQEYSCCRIHMNLIGITTLIDAVAYPSDEQLQQVINETHAQGGIVVVNHIPWSLNGPFRDQQPTLDQLYSWGVDYIEIVNGFTYDLQSLSYAMEHNLGIITGTDMHAPDRGVNGWTTLLPANFSEEAIFDELKAHRTSIIYNAVDSPNYENPRTTLQSVMLDPFYRYGAAFSDYWSMNGGMYSFVHGEMCNSQHLTVQTGRVFAGIMWLTILFIFFEVTRQTGIKLFEKYKKWKKTESKRNTEKRWHTLITNDYIGPTTDEEASQHFSAMLDYEQMIY